MIDKILQKLGLVRIKKIKKLVEHYAKDNEEKCDRDFNLGRTYMMHFIEVELGIIERKYEKCLKE